MREKVLTILAIEDNQDMLALIGRILRSEGYRVILAEDSRYGMEMFEADRPDLVLLDIKMPPPDGFKVLKSLRKLSDVPVIIVSAYWDKKIVERAFALGADSYMKKPFSSDELITRIKMRLRGVPSQRTNGKREINKPDDEDDVAGKK